MKLRARWSRLGPRTKVLSSLVLVFAVVIMVFDWNWFRGPLERYLYKKSNREIRIEDLHVTLGLTLAPTVRLRGVYIENAPWAVNKQPLVVAGEAAFTFSLRSLLERRPIVTRLVLHDADVDLERQADGLRNWRLRNPDDRSPGRVKVMTLEAYRTRIRFIHGGSDILGVATSTPVLPVLWSQMNEALSNRIAFNVTHRGTVFAGVALTGDLLSFRESGVSFPLRGYVMMGKARLDVDGSIADIFDLSTLDAKVRIAGPTLASLQPLFPHFGASRSFMADARVKYADKEYTLERLRAKIGGTEISGDGSYNRNSERPLLRAALGSRRADLSDLASLAGISYPGRGSASPTPETSRATRKTPLGAADARVTVEIRNLRAGDMPAVENLRLTADLTDGVLQLTPLDFGVAGGKVAGSLLFDTQHEPPSARATIDILDVRLEKLVPSLSATAHGSGAINARIKLAGEGSSGAAMLAGSAGSVAAVIDRGYISNLVDAKLGLNGGKLLGLLIRGDRQIALNCGAIAFEFHKGLGKSRVILLDTEQTSIEGSGAIDLRKQQIALLLTPTPKRPGLLTLRSSIEIQGSFKPGAFSFDQRIVQERVTSASMPRANYAVFAPLLKTAQTKDSPCVSLLQPNPAGRNSVAVKE